MASNATIQQKATPYGGYATSELLYSGTATTSFATAYTAPSGTTPTGSSQYTEITDICVCNTDSAQRTFYVCVVAPAGSAVAANSRFWGCTILAGTTYFTNEMKVIVPSGYTVQIKADSGSVVNFTFQGQVHR